MALARNDIAQARLSNQLVAKPRFDSPAEAVRWLGAVQAQDYLASLWALGLRVPDTDEGAIEAALADRSVIRTHVFRGTWQFVARDDVRWMVALVGARVIASAAARLAQLELPPKRLERSTEILETALAGERLLTRDELAAELQRRRLPLAGPRLMHALWYAELRGVTCCAGRRGKQPVFALVDERAPDARALTREESLAELAARYFQSRGPATERDFAWWSGLPLREVREAIELARARLDSAKLGDAVQWFVELKEATPASRGVHLLPAFDEYLVGYQDRDALIDPVQVRKINRGGGILNPALVIDGKVQGTWKRTIGKRDVSLAVESFRALTARERAGLQLAAERYGTFLGLAPRLDMRSV